VEVDHGVEETGGGRHSDTGVGGDVVGPGHIPDQAVAAERVARIHVQEAVPGAVPVIVEDLNVQEDQIQDLVHVQCLRPDTRKNPIQDRNLGRSLRGNHPSEMEKRQAPGQGHTIGKVTRNHVVVQCLVQGHQVLFQRSLVENEVLVDLEAAADREVTTGRNFFLYM